MDITVSSAVADLFIPRIISLFTRKDMEDRAFDGRKSMTIMAPANERVTVCLALACPLLRAPWSHLRTLHAGPSHPMR